jgi:hypothetical protein
MAANRAGNRQLAGKCVGNPRTACARTRRRSCRDQKSSSDARTHVAMPASLRAFGQSVSWVGALLGRVGRVLGAALRGEDVLDGRRVVDGVVAGLLVQAVSASVRTSARAQDRTRQR